MAHETDQEAPLSAWKAPSHPGDVTLSGTYAQLEPLTAERHAADLFRANQSDDAIWDYLPYGPFASAAAYHRWVVGVAGQSDPQFLAIRNAETGRFEGVASYLRIKPDAGSIEVGHINYSPPLQRTRAATEAMYLMMKWVFEAGYRRYEWKCNALNLKSRRAAERFGFSYEGVFRQHLVVKGKNRDTAWFAAIDKEWPALKAAYETWLDPDNFDQNGQQRESLADLTRLVRVSDDPTAN